MSQIYIQEPPTEGKILLQTSAGDYDIELWSKEAPKACRNFIQLCLENYYDGTIFHRLLPGFIVQGGDPTGTGDGGESIYGKPFKDEFHTRLRFVRRGLVAMANAGANDNGSQFFFTLGPTKELQNKHTIFGKVAGDTQYNLSRFEEGEIGNDDRPEFPHKIIKTKILNNPFPDIIPRAKIVNEISKEERKKKKKGTKNFKLLSFGDEAFEDEEASAQADSALPNQGKSAHDIAKDPKLSKKVLSRIAEDPSKVIQRIHDKLNTKTEESSSDDSDDEGRHTRTDASAERIGISKGEASGLAQSEKRSDQSSDKRKGDSRDNMENRNKDDKSYDRRKENMPSPSEEGSRREKKRTLSEVNDRDEGKRDSNVKNNEKRDRRDSRDERKRRDSRSSRERDRRASGGSRWDLSDEKDKKTYEKSRKRERTLSFEQDERYEGKWGDAKHEAFKRPNRNEDSKSSSKEEISNLHVKSVAESDDSKHTERNGKQVHSENVDEKKEISPDLIEKKMKNENDDRKRDKEAKISKAKPNLDDKISKSERQNQEVKISKKSKAETNDEDNISQPSDVKAEIKRLKRELSGKPKKEEIKSGSEIPNEDKISLSVQEYQSEIAKYVKGKELILAKGRERELHTLDVLKKFTKKVQSLSERLNEIEDEDELKEEDLNDDSWMNSKLQFDENAVPVVAKDASTKDDHWYDITDPRNAINKSRRENPSKDTDRDRKRRE